MARTTGRRSGESRRGRWHGAVASALMLVFAGAVASAADPEGYQVSSDPVFKALMVDGKESSGRIASFGPDAITIASDDGVKAVLPLKGLIKLTRQPMPPPTPRDDSQAVILPDGDRLMRAAIGSSTDTTLEVRSESLGKLEVPLDSLLGLILSASGESGTFDALWDRILAEPRKTEVVWMINGDRLDGSFLGMDERKVKLEIDQKPLEVDRAGVVSLGFDPGLANYPRPKGVFLELSLTDGTRLGVVGAKLEEGNVQATTRFGQPVRFALGELTRVIVQSESVVYLTESHFVKPIYVSYIGPTRVCRTDRAVDGRPFQLAGQMYDRGIGTHSRTFLVYRIQPGDRRFQALVGVDDRAGPLGSVVFRVLVDGEARFRSQVPKTSRDEPE
ncbi:MAG: NPCBM/NEW2 domain-containing protein, partial [Isosphaeraceae bacterium]